MNSSRMQILPIVAVLFFGLLQLSYGQTTASSPVPPPTSDGTAIDQGIAYLLLLVALAITPIANQTLKHPMFWNAERIISFWKVVADRVQTAITNKEAALITAIANCFALNETWDQKIDQSFLQEMLKPVNFTRSLKYDYRSLQNLLRFMRNALVHFAHLSGTTQLVLGTSEEEKDYFSIQFPGLLMKVYEVLFYGNLQEDVVDKFKWK